MIATSSTSRRSILRALEAKERSRWFHLSVSVVLILLFQTYSFVFFFDGMRQSAGLEAVAGGDIVPVPTQTPLVNLISSLDGNEERKDGDSSPPIDDLEARKDSNSSPPIDDHEERKDDDSPPPFDCGCPMTCSPSALSAHQNGLPYSCGRRVQHMMTKYQYNHTDACRIAANQATPACGPQCDPDMCQRWDGLPFLQGDKQDAEHLTSGSLGNH